MNFEDVELCNISITRMKKINLPGFYQKYFDNGNEQMISENIVEQIADNKIKSYYQSFLFAFLE